MNKVISGSRSNYLQQIFMIYLVKSVIITRGGIKNEEANNK